jgi:hypothetical protein
MDEQRAEGNTARQVGARILIIIGGIAIPVAGTLMIGPVVGTNAAAANVPALAAILVVAVGVLALGAGAALVIWGVRMAAASGQGSGGRQYGRSREGGGHRYDDDRMW